MYQKYIYQFILKWTWRIDLFRSFPISNINQPQLFISCTAANRGGAIAIGRVREFTASRLCFDLNAALYGHDIHLNTLLDYHTTKYVIEDISEVRGTADHGSIYGSTESSTCRNHNLTGFSGKVSLNLHFSTNTDEFSRLILTNTTANQFFGINVVSGTTTIKETVFIYAGDNMGFTSHSGTVSIEDSVFIFVGTPTFPKKVIVKNSVSNKKISDFSYEANPNIPQFHMIDCFNILEKCGPSYYNGLSRYLSLSIGVVPLIKIEKKRRMRPSN